MNRTKTTICLLCGIALSIMLQLGLPEASAEILSPKRGTGHNGATYDHLQATGSSWYYTWGTGLANPGNFDADFYPMFWNAPNQATINSVKNQNPVSILGFNEPERTDQANMSVEQALDSWSAISNSFAGTSTQLISPGVADTVDGGGMLGGRTWLQNFMTGLNERKTNPQNPKYNPNLRVDAVAFHWYGSASPNDPIGAAYSFLGSIDMYHAQYGLPVYITEFAIHDWGNNYSDAAIIEANRQFLDFVIPALESRSYVEGYAWFHYFSDSPLYTGTPLTPTPMGYKYIGAVETGDVADIGGQDLGEHAAYLTGGELTMTGATPGTIRYIDALANTNTISASLDWELNPSSNWVRIRSGAKLRKDGPNRISFGTGPVSNDGSLEVAQGTLQVRSSVSGNGSVRVAGGTLELLGAGRFNTAPSFDVEAGGTLDVSGITGTFRVPLGQTLDITAGATVVGNVTSAVGSTVAGGGTFTDNLTAQSGSTIRVGNEGTGISSRVLIDDFESYALGDVRNTASPPWTAHQNTDRVDIENIDGNKALSYGQAGFPANNRGASRNLPVEAVLDNSSTATIFFRFNSKTDAPNHSIGLGDQATTGTVDFDDYEAQLRLKQDSSAGTFALDAIDNGRFSSTLASGLALDSWYNIWMVVDQTTDQYDLYMNTGTDPASPGDKLNASPLLFRNGTESNLNTFLALAGLSEIDNGVRIDDIVFQPGIDFTNHAAGFNSGANWIAETFTVNGDYIQNAGAILQLDLLDTVNHDILKVLGSAQVGGTLDIAWAVGASDPQAGDQFDIFDFGSASGGFATINLPPLASGLTWDTSHLLATGILKVVGNQAGDFDGDGDVDGHDFLAWQRNPTLGDLADWQANYGAPSPLSSTFTSVPEPTGATLLLLFTLICSIQTGGRRDGPL